MTRSRKSRPKFSQPISVKPISVKLTLFNRQLRIFLSALFSLFIVGYWQNYWVLAQTVPSYVLPDDTFDRDIYQLAQSTTVRIVRGNTSGTGVIIHQEEQTYTVLTSWHVVGDGDSITVITTDGNSYQLADSPQQIGDLDLGIVQFNSQSGYEVATLATDAPQMGEKIYAAGFPLYEADGLSDTIYRGAEAFRLTQGEISLIPPKSLPEGYFLGYTNDTEIGMSGGPIFNSKGFLIGVHGRGKYRDPSFGVYTFADGSEPSPTMLEKMIESSWGIPISTYLQSVSQAAQN